MKNLRKLYFVLGLSLFMHGCGPGLHSGLHFGRGLTTHSRVILMESVKTEEYEIPSGLYFPILFDEVSMSMGEVGQTLFFQSIKEKIFLKGVNGLTAREGGLAINLVEGKADLKYWSGNFLGFSAEKLPETTQFLFTGKNEQGQLLVEAFQITHLNCEKFLRIISLEPSYYKLWSSSGESLDQNNLSQIKGCLNAGNYNKSNTKI